MTIVIEVESPSFREAVLRVRRKAVLLGRVVDGDRNPVADVSVEEWSDDDDRRREYYTLRGLWPRTTTGKNGRFALEGVDPSPRLKLVCESNRVRRTMTAPTAIGAGEDCDLGDIVVPRGLRCSLFAHGPTRPVAGAEFMIVDGPRGRFEKNRQRAWVTTDADGRAVFDFVSGPAISLEYVGGPFELVPRSIADSYDVSGGGSTIDIVFVRRQRMSARVRTIEGEPVVGAYLRIDYVDPDGKPIASTTSNRNTDGSGRIIWDSGPWTKALVTDVKVAKEDSVVEYEVVDAREIEAGIDVEITIRRKARTQSAPR